MKTCSCISAHGKDMFAKNLAFQDATCRSGNVCLLFLSKGPPIATFNE